jgi:uncharacterized protein
MSIKHILQNLPTKIMMALAIIVSIGIESNGALAKAPTAKALLWEISGNGLQKSSYLFGTVHLGCKSRLALSPVQKQTLNKVQQLYLEIDGKDKSNGNQPSPKIPGGKKLKDIMTASEYQKVEDYFGRYNLEEYGLTDVRPFTLSSKASWRIGSKVARKMCREVVSKEEVIEDFAKKRKLPISGIETTQDRNIVDSKLPLQDEVKDLLETLSYKDLSTSVERDFANLDSMYGNQDINGIITEASKKKIPTIINALGYERHQIWLPRMSKIMSQKSTFFAFGAAHLGGEKGLISLLEAKGYILRPIFDIKINQSSKMTANEYFESARNNRLEEETLDALDNYTKAIALNPRYAEAYYYRGLIIKNQLNDPQNALADFNQSITINPKYFDAYYVRSLVRGENFKDYKGAVTDLNQAILLEPTSMTPYYDRGILKWEKLNDPAGAFADFNMAISLSPQDPNGYLARGMLKYKNLNDQSGGIADVRRSIKLAKLRDDTQTLEKARVALKFMEASEQAVP